jgi:hypothetical protein
MDFEQQFAAWLNDGLAGDTPDNVKAFSFNLYEPAGIPDVKFGVEIVGAGSFDAEDPDWPCDEVWEPQPRGIPIPVAYSGDTWEECLQRIRTLVVQTLGGQSPAVQQLKSSQGVGIGFVDGDLEVIWKP